LRESDAIFEFLPTRLRQAKLLIQIIIFIGHYMARKLSTLERLQAAVQQAREEAFEAARKADSELYRTSRNAVSEARDALQAIQPRFRALSEVKSHADALHHELMNSGLEAEAGIVAHLLPSR
jgi:multidrug efflux pump subunit AcrA (membrane-fusion protein)